MGTGRTDGIAAALRALPYRSPSAGFRARVMAAVKAEAAARARLALAVKCLSALLVSWAGLVGLVSAGGLWRLAADYGPLALEPGGAPKALRLLGARAALLAGKAAAALPAAREVADGAAGLLPPAQDLAAAVLLGTAAIWFVTGRRAAAQRI